MIDFDVIIIGGGPAGCFAGIQASKNGAKVLLLERNEKIGKKLYITGKGRCNLTNYSDNQTHLNNIVNGSKFMISALNSFSADDTVNFFEDNGLALKVERGNRVFPISDKSSDVIKVLEHSLRDLNVKIEFNTKVEKISKNNEIFHIKCNNGKTYTSYSVVIATGGKSYQPTGSDGYGYNLAKSFGHTIVEPMPALTPILLKDDVTSLEGLSLKNVEASIQIESKVIAKEFGEMLFTYEGVSGPIVLTMSSKINRIDLNNAILFIDLKPAISKEELDEKLIREFKANSKILLTTYLKSLLPSSLVDFFFKKLKIENKTLSQINKEERKTIVNQLKRFDFFVKMLDNINKAIITSGGVCTKEINPKTMESKLAEGLYFAGEIIDVDALTGGFNLQVAFSTGFVAGNNCFKGV